MKQFFNFAKRSIPLWTNSLNVNATQEQLPSEQQIPKERFKLNFPNADRGDHVPIPTNVKSQLLVDQTLLDTVSKILSEEEKSTNITKAPKYPQNLATLLEVSSDSPEEDRNIEGHIMSVSKSFCGATTALMAADGKFGEKKMQASLLDVLQEAKDNHPERMEQINQYQDMINRKGCGDVTMEELLSHRSGFTQGGTYLDPGNLTNVEIFNSDQLFSFDPTQKENRTWSYCNPAFVLAEELIGLVSDSSQGYYGELQDRVIKPLGLKNTKYVYESEEAQASAKDAVVIEGVMYDYGVKSKKTERSNFLNATQRGSLELSEGGLASTVKDLETFYGELSKMACAMPSKLVSGKKQSQDIHGFYRDAYNQGENTHSSKRSNKLFERCATQYSLGVIIEAVDENGKVVDENGDPLCPSRGNEDKRVSFHHLGGSGAGNASVTCVMPLSFQEFIDGTGQLHGNEGLEFNVFMKQSDVLVKDSLLTMVSCDYIAQMEGYFSDKCDKQSDQYYNDIDEEGINWRDYSLYFEAARTGVKVGQKWQDDLVKEGKLPNNFPDYHDQIMEAYAPARQVLTQYVQDNYLNQQGVIDSEKIKKDFNKKEDFGTLQEILEPHLQVARQQTQAVFAKADKALAVRHSIAADCFENFFADKDIPAHRVLERNVLKNGLETLLEEAVTEKGDPALKLDTIKSKQDLFTILNNINPDYLGQIDRSYLRGKHKITEGPSLVFSDQALSASNEETLQQYVKEKKLSVVASLSQAGVSSNISSSKEMGNKTIFNIQSVGKIINGALVMKMLEEGVLKQEQLNQPVQLDQEVLEALPEAVQKKLEETTLHQLMTHQSGLKDYLPKYIGSIEKDEEARQEAIKKGGEIPTAKTAIIKETEDLLQYADPEVLTKKEVAELGGIKYSNLGIALVGLAVKKAYNDKYPPENSQKALSFDAIRQKHVLGPAKVEIFENYIPQTGACVHPDDNITPLIAGGPDGGQWTDLESLNKFGAWFCDQWKAPKKEGHPSFKEMVEQYGQEFYKPDQGVIEHNGSGPTSSAYLSIFPESETIFVSAASNRFDAIVLHDLVLPELTKERPLQHENQIVDETSKNQTSQSFVDKFCSDRNPNEAKNKASWADRVSENKEEGKSNTGERE